MFCSRNEAPIWRGWGVEIFRKVFAGGLKFLEKSLLGGVRNCFFLGGERVILCSGAGGFCFVLRSVIERQVIAHKK